MRPSALSRSYRPGTHRPGALVERERSVSSVVELRRIAGVSRGARRGDAVLALMVNGQFP